MRRRPAPAPTAGTLRPYVPAVPWTPQVWADWMQWKADLDAYAAAHPEAAEAVEAVLEESVVPDAPFDPREI